MIIKFEEFNENFTPIKINSHKPFKVKDNLDKNISVLRDGIDALKRKLLKEKVLKTRSEIRKEINKKYAKLKEIGFYKLKQIEYLSNVDESIRDEFPGMFAPRKPEDEPQVVPGFEGGTIDPEDDEPFSFHGEDPGPSEKEQYKEFVKVTKERNFKEDENFIEINLHRLYQDYFMSIYNCQKHFMKFLKENLIGKYICDGYENILTDENIEGIIKSIRIIYDGDSAFISFKINNNNWIENDFCKSEIKIDKLKSIASNYNL